MLVFRRGPCRGRPRQRPLLSRQGVMAKDDQLTITAERTNGGKIQGHLRHLYGCARRWKLAAPTRGANTKRHMLREPMMQDPEFITHANDQPIYKLHGCIGSRSRKASDCSLLLAEQDRQHRYVSSRCAIPG